MIFPGQSNAGDSLGDIKLLPRSADWCETYAVKTKIYGSLWNLDAGAQLDDSDGTDSTEQEPVFPFGYPESCAVALAKRLCAHHTVDFSPRNGWNGAGFVCRKMRYMCFAMTESHKRQIETHTRASVLEAMTNGRIQDPEVMKIMGKVSKGKQPLKPDKNDNGIEPGKPKPAPKPRGDPKKTGALTRSQAEGGDPGTTEPKPKPSGKKEKKEKKETKEPAEEPKKKKIKKEKKDQSDEAISVLGDDSSWSDE